MDERFKMHRLYSTRFAMMIGVITIFVWFVIDTYFYDNLRWDLCVIMLIIVVAKFGAMIYYRITN